MLYLDINDWQLTARSEDGTLLLREPMAASRASGALVFGFPALRQSRSHPQQFNYRYLYSLAPDPISGDMRPAKNHADLIFHHLSRLDMLKEQPVVMGIGGHLTNQQLGLLLGICQEAGIEVAGFVDLALAQSLGADTPASYFVLDVELHRATLTEIEVDGQLRTQRQTVTWDGAGVANMIDGWMNVIADEFVQKTRFDPLHAGQSEQQLFDQVYTWLGQGALSSQRISVTHGEASRDIEVDRQLLTDKLRQRLLAFDVDHIEQLFVTPRAAAVPSLVQLLTERGCNAAALEEPDVVAGYQALAAQLEPGDVRRVSQVKVEQADNAPEAVTQPAAPAVTHLLREHVAYGLDHESFKQHIDPALGAALNGQVSVNGGHAAGTPLNPGDQVIIGEATYTAIRIE